MNMTTAATFKIGGCTEYGVLECHFRFHKLRDGQRKSLIDKISIVNLGVAVNVAAANLWHHISYHKLFSTDTK